jgi:hypothetical protein
MGIRIWALAAAVLAAPPTAELRVIADFPGGSARVERIDPATRTIRVLPATHPGRGWDCWWYFKVEGLSPGETVTLDVGGGVWATPDRAAVSADGKSWRQTPPGERHEKERIRYRVEAPGSEAWFAWGPPFVLADAREAVGAAVRACPDGARAFELCRSREGRSVPAARVGPAGQAREAVWIQARQHAWESGGSWVARGFLEWLASDDARARALKARAEVVVVPIMDVDNVERGAGGKEQKPQDHNRDWSEDPHWPEVRAAQAELSRWIGEGRLALFVDLHNPGARNLEPYFYVSPRDLLAEEGRAALEVFLAAARAEITGPLRFTGHVEASGAKYDPRWERISKNWVTRRCGGLVRAVTLETAWNTPHSTAEGYRRVGRELGLAVERYLREQKP